MTTIAQEDSTKKLIPSPQTFDTNEIIGLVGGPGWEQLQLKGLNPNEICFWSRIHQVKIQDPAPKPVGGMSGLFKSISEKVASAVEQGSGLVSNRLLIIAPRNRWFLIGHFGFASNTFLVDPANYVWRLTTKDSKVEVELKCRQPAEHVQSLVITLDFHPEIPPGFFGNLDCVFGEWLAGQNRHFQGITSPCPVVTRASKLQKGGFQYLLADLGPMWMTIKKDSLRIFGPTEDCTIQATDVVFWRPNSEGSAISIFHGKNGNLATWILGHEQDSESNQFGHFREISPASQPEVKEGVTSGQPNSETIVKLGKAIVQSPAKIDLARSALRVVLEFLVQHCGNAKADTAFFGAELNTTPVFDAPVPAIALSIHAGKCTAWVGEGVVRSRFQDGAFTAYSFPSGYFLQTTNGHFYRVEVPITDLELWQSICKATQNKQSIKSPFGVLVEIQNMESGNSAMGTIRLEETGLLAIQENGKQLWAVSPLDISDSSSAWSEYYGTIGFTNKETGSCALTATLDTVLDVWKNKEKQRLQMTIAGVKLGKLYEEYQNRRMDQVLAGLFGHFIVAQQKLDEGISLDKIRKEITEAPPGALSDSQVKTLVQKLAILEIARQKISRWIDRCSLFLPHHIAVQEKLWLDRVFGHGLDSICREKEMRRVQLSVRAELRQVQFALGRPLQELANNLNAISFAFPEEVKNAGLAGVRAAADLANKGAIMAAFGGLGAQLLLGVGRASVGDPFAIAFLGSTGLSLVGKHLQQKAMDKEQQLKIRAFGLQALEWWDVVLDSVFVTAFECRQAFDAQIESIQLRDRKLLESLSVENLSRVQQNMAFTLKCLLQESLESQFQEIIPGSGLLGYHVTRRLEAAVDSRPIHSIRQFGSEFIGTIYKEV